MVHFLKCLLLLFLLPFQGLAQTPQPFDSISNYPCSPNTFWSINSNGQIQQWTMTNSVVTGGQVILTNPNGWSLSYCGNEYDQTFFSGMSMGGINFYKAPNWPSISNPNLNYSNSGGCRQHQYYWSNWNLYYYNGFQFKYLFNANFRVADIAVDTLGRAWVLTVDTVNVQSLKLVDTSGTIVNTYTLYSTVQPDNAYGMMLFNNQLYVAFGNMHATYAGKLVPLHVSGTGFTYGTPIHFPEPVVPYFVDLASCIPSKPKTNTGLTHYAREADGFYPNPSSGRVYLRRSDIRSMVLYDAYGTVLHTFERPQHTLDLHMYPTGVYFLQWTTDTRSEFHKLVLTN